MYFCAVKQLSKTAMKHVRQSEIKARNRRMIIEYIKSLIREDMIKAAIEVAEHNGIGPVEFGKISAEI